MNQITIGLKELNKIQKIVIDNIIKNFLLIIKLILI